MPIPQQLVQLLTEEPGSLVYHIVTLFALQATLGLALWQYRRSGEDLFARRLAWAATGILIARVAVAFAIIANQDQRQAAAVLPPLEQAVDTATALFIVWALAPQLSNLPRLADALLIVGLILLGFVYAYTAQEWPILADSEAASIGYYNTDQARVLGVVQITLLAFGAVALLARRQQYWSFRLAIIAVLLLAHLGQIWNSPEIVATDTNVAYLTRLGNLVAFPMLAIMAFRHSVGLLLDTQASDRSATVRLTRTLQLSRQVIRSLDKKRTLREALALAGELFRADFIALALRTSAEPDHLQLYTTGARPADMADGPSADKVPLHSWALNLGDWPAIRLSMQQRQQVELIPDGLGARQLHHFYKELGIGALGALLIEPLHINGDEIGVLLLAASPDQDRWPASDKAMGSIVGTFLAQAIANARRYEMALQDASVVDVADSSQVSGQIVALEQARESARIEIEELRNRLLHTEERLASATERGVKLKSALEAAQKSAKSGAVAELEEEVAALRESLAEAEDAMAMAAAGEEGLSADWVMRTVTRYSGELEEAQERIQQLEASLALGVYSTSSEAARALATDLQTPLITVATFADILLGEAESGLDDEQLGLISQLRTSVGQMTKAVNRVLGATEVSGPVPAERSLVDVRKAIESAITEVSPQLQHKRLVLDLDLDSSLPEVLSESDAFVEIVVGLLSNACQVSVADSRLQLRAQRNIIAEDTADGTQHMANFLHLAVSDSGGIRSQEIHSLVQKSLRQPDNRQIREQLAEVGQSLSTAVSLVNSLGGRTWVFAENGTGSTFSVLLPLSLNGSSSKGSD